MQILDPPHPSPSHSHTHTHTHTKDQGPLPLPRTTVPSCEPPDILSYTTAEPGGAVPYAELEDIDQSCRGRQNIVTGSLTIPLPIVSRASHIFSISAPSLDIHGSFVRLPSPLQSSFNVSLGMRWLISHPIHMGLTSSWSDLVLSCTCIRPHTLSQLQDSVGIMTW